MATLVFPPNHPAYPPALADLPRRRPPSGAGPLFVRGAWPPRQGVAVVGTREPSPAALAFARAVAFSIVDAGWAVWSGGARGIDAAAHTAAMERGGVTVVVSPSGLDVPYPPEHAELFDRVLAGGGTLIAPFADDVRPRRAAFHQRNEVLAALTIATVVVQAGAKSGARSTARAARRLERPLFVVPQAPWDEKGAGCALELAIGARALTSGNALITSLGKRAPLAGPSRHVAQTSEPASAASPPRALASPEHAHAHALQELGQDATRVFASICDMPIHTDDLCDRTALPIGTVMAALLTLTLQAVVVEAPAGFYRRQTV